MLNEFKAFAMRGNMMDLAIGVIIGAAFGKIISSLVDNVLMPLIGLATGGTNFSALAITVGDAKVTYGVFLQNVVDFLIIAFVVFMLVRSMNKMKKEAPAAAPDTKDCPFCLSTIPLAATRCGHCTSELK